MLAKLFLVTESPHSAGFGASQAREGFFTAKLQQLQMSCCVCHADAVPSWNSSSFYVVQNSNWSIFLTMMNDYFMQQTNFFSKKTCVYMIFGWNVNVNISLTWAFQFFGVFIRASKTVRDSVKQHLDREDLEHIDCFIDLADAFPELRLVFVRGSWRD